MSSFVLFSILRNLFYLIAGAGGLPLGVGASAENDHLGLSVGQAGFHTPPNGSDQYQFREFRPAGRPGFLPRPRRLLDRMVRTLLHALPRQEDRSIPLRSSCCLVAEQVKNSST